MMNDRNRGRGRSGNDSRRRQGGGGSQDIAHDRGRRRDWDQAEDERYTSDRGWSARGDWPQGDRGYGDYRGYGRGGDQSYSGEPPFGGSSSSGYGGGSFGGRRSGSDDWQRPSGGYAGDFEQGYRERSASQGGYERGGDTQDWYGQRDSRERSYGSQSSLDQRGFGSGQGRQAYASYGQSSSGASGQFGRGQYDYSAREPQGWSQQQNYSGRGPKGYQRSDERLKEQVSDRLMDDPQIDASDITVEVEGGEATLTGTVGSREEKRAAESCVEGVSGIREVINQLRVSRSDTQSSGGSQSKGTAGSAQTAKSSRSSERGES